MQEMPSHKRYAAKLMDATVRLGKVKVRTQRELCL